ncbi:Mu transposase C-terminal domain-containing protein [Legionella israelensis]|uniref:Mu transposase C-terminal domain-containing protein n=1 Tax=Legionella israelensis TaxID=454 RepID=UPI001FCFDB82|nr:Mu transposase C-terminal domain-containing protein [Legionella israelensis]
MLFIREAQRPNHIWQADHTLLDIHILNEKDEIKRPWFTVIMDDYSRAIAGYYLSFNAPSSQQTSLAFRQAIWRKKEKNWLICGVPELLYTDHGSDFTSHHIEEVCASLKIQLIFSAVGKPRGRGKIERFFSTINQQLLESLPGYTQHKQPSKKNKFLTVEELDARIKSFILSDYNSQPHSSTKIEPNTRWQQNYFLPQFPESQEVLDLLLLTVAKPRTVHRQGIKFQGFRYLSPILAGYVGEKVVIRYDPRDMAEIRVFYQNKFLCRAFAQELESQTVSLKEIIKARNLRKKELQRNIKERRSLVDSILNIHPSVQEASKTQSCKEDKTQKPKKKSNPIKRYTNE